MLKYIILICVVGTTTTQTKGPLLEIEHGILRGAHRKSLNGRTFSSFTGIPYAEPPVGELRFETAIPARSWEGVLDATKPHAVCPQMDIYVGNHNFTGDEDCLYLNVYTPQLERLSNQELLPVMFFIHGGGFTCGDANWYNPDILLNHDVVLVTINYRLGALGFLSTGNLVVPGNNGLKDQNLALKWVRKNIVHFGGDLNSITVFGQSAGGASAHYHVVSPLSKNLIKRAILQSGSAVAPWALGTKKDMLENTKQLANLINCPYTPSKALVECLKKIPANEIVKQTLKFMQWSYFPPIIFRPVVEEMSDEAFLFEKPSDIIKDNKVGKVDIMVGFILEDGAISTAFTFTQQNLLDDVNNDFNRVASLVLLLDKSHKNPSELMEKVRKFYFGNQKIGESTKFNYTNMITDVWFHLPSHKTIDLHKKYTQQNVFSYVFGYRGTDSFTSLFSGINDKSDYGVCHCDELIYLFNFPINPNKILTEEDLKMNNIMSKLWTNFARTGNPTSSKNGIITNTWDPVKTKNFEYYFINNRPEMQKDFELNRRQFWENITPSLKPHKTIDEL